MIGKLFTTIGCILSLAVGHGLMAQDKKVNPQADKEGFVPIFDGKTLAGWEEMPAVATKAWSVLDGTIVGEGDKGRGYLVYENRELADFELKFSYRFPGKGNSGVSVRARPDETGRRKFQSYHADLGDLGSGKQVHGISMCRDARSTPAFGAIASSLMLTTIPQ